MIPTPLLGCDRRQPATDVELSTAERALGVPLPPDYAALMGETNGLEGFVAQEAYLILWAVSDVPSLNEAYGVSEFLTGVTLIGTDGGDTGYGFKLRDGQVEYVSTPLVGMEPAALKKMGSSLDELAAQIRDGKP
jgi:hypothetical protein